MASSSSANGVCGGGAGQGSNWIITFTFYCQLEFASEGSAKVQSENLYLSISLFDRWPEFILGQPEAFSKKVYFRVSF